MILLKISQFFIQAFNLHLQISSRQGQLIENSAQAIDVSLHTLAKSHFILISVKKVIKCAFYVVDEVKCKLTLCLYSF